MTTQSNRRSATRLSVDLARMALEAPQVAATRMQRMAQAGSTPSAADRREFQRMWAEKQAAFTQSWQAMALSWTQAWWRMAFGWALRPPMSAASAFGRMQRQGQQTAIDMLGRGLRPVRSKVSANARRLRG
jgi:hypothetical protein